MEILTTARPISLIQKWVLETQNLGILGFRSIVGAFRRPLYLRETFEMMDIIGVGSLGIVLLTGFFTGAVLALQTSRTLSSFGAVGYTGQLVAISLVRELGPVLTAVVVAGRVGSGIASEIGSMLVSEQIDAMRALGTDPVKKLVTPRVLASVAMVPVLTIICDIVGVFGGFFVAVFLLGISPMLYLTSCYDQLNYSDLVQGLTKPPVFGFIVAIVGSYCGLRTYGGTQGVGRSTTQSVVASMILVFVSDFFITRLLISFI
ncbi:MAG TPA: ABC transporter permease [Terriglobia bacterium]|nr:ABC transporter permease [Terriglobia bacterium]